MNGFRLPLALSLTAHAILLALLLRLPSPVLPLQPPAPTGGIEVAFAPSLPVPEKPPTPVKTEPPPPPPPVVMPPPPPPPPSAIEPPPPAPEPAVVAPEAPAPPPPPRKPAIPARVKPVLRRPEPERPSPAFAAPTPSLPQTALAHAPAPARPPSTEISPNYRALLSEWLENHKRYPESAREQGEEGRAVLRFVVERSGRVVDYAVIKSSGYPDLDAAVDAMMRGATLPRFPAGMDQPSIEVAVTIRFSLGR